MYKTIVDIAATTEEGIDIIIEMQYTSIEASLNAFALLYGASTYMGELFCRPSNL